MVHASRLGSSVFIISFCFALCISLIEPRFQPLPEDRRCDADEEDRCGVAVQEEGPHDPAAAMLLVMCLLEHENKQYATV